MLLHELDAQLADVFVDVDDGHDLDVGIGPQHPVHVIHAAAIHPDHGDVQFFVGTFDRFPFAFGPSGLGHRREGGRRGGKNGLLEKIPAALPDHVRCPPENGNWSTAVCELLPES